MQETPKSTVLDQNELNKPNFTPPINIIDFDQEELQPSLNLGVIGHVSHGKSTVVRALTGKRYVLLPVQFVVYVLSTAKFHKEHEKNMTIKLGYANCKLWQCTFCRRYFSTQSEVMCMSSFPSLFLFNFTSPQ
jgi:translation initiation factor 2 gamma subunit (eIF-2gamma)